jgi:transposase
MSGNSLGVVLSPGGLAAAERSGGSPPGEPQRSAAAPKAGADPGLASRPDPEVVAKPKRRTYTAEYKQRILQEAEVAATTRGGLGALLRREGLYSSLLTYWRRERAHGILEALTPQKRGPKSKRNPMEEEVQKLRRQNARLTEDLRKAHIIIDVQKKVAALLEVLDFAASGYGASYAEILLRKFWGTLTLHSAVLLSLYVVHQTQKHVCTVGGGTDVVILRSHGKSATMTSALTKPLSEKLEKLDYQFEGAFFSALYGVTWAMDADDFRDRVAQTRGELQGELDRLFKALNV